MTKADLIRDIRAYAAEHERNGVHYPTAVPGLSVLCDPRPTGFQPMVYDPVACLVLQGAKETRGGGRVVRFGAGEALVVSHSVPVTAAITEASPDAPYVAMVLSLDLGIARSLHDEIGGPGEEEARNLVAAQAGPELTDAFARLFRAGSSAADTRVLAPLITREIHFRLLCAPHGAMLRRMLWRDSTASRIGQVIARLRADLAAPMPVPEMAKLAGMSVSAFHDHFKAVTGQSPLQYRKDMRLTEARRLLLETDSPVSSVAFEVGYESPTQFSREYARKFGMPPRRDAARTPAA